MLAHRRLRFGKQLDELVGRRTHGPMITMLYGIPRTEGRGVRDFVASVEWNEMLIVLPPRDEAEK